MQWKRLFFISFSYRHTFNTTAGGKTPAVIVRTPLIVDKGFSCLIGVAINLPAAGAFTVFSMMFHKTSHIFHRISKENSDLVRKLFIVFKFTDQTAQTGGNRKIRISQRNQQLSGIFSVQCLFKRCFSIDVDQSSAFSLFHRNCLNPRCA